MSQKRLNAGVLAILAMLGAVECSAGVRNEDHVLAAHSLQALAAAGDPIVLAQVAPGTSEAQAVVEATSEVAAPVGWIDRIGGFLAESYAREPALMIAVALVLVLSPVLSIVLLVTQSARRMLDRKGATRGPSLKQALQAAGSLSTATTEPGPAAYWSSEAVLEFVDEDYEPLPLIGRMLRIGRHEENDVRLADKTVHRHHAVLQVTGEQGYTITDLSGAEGNGVLVNSERVTQARLRHGDIIELGAVKLRFALESGRTSGRSPSQTQITLH
ncbi:MAG: FHA domain-containing protein [Hyphomicrobiaceae bacterium]